MRFPRITHILMRHVFETKPQRQLIPGPVDSKQKVPVTPQNTPKCTDINAWYV